MALFTVTQIIDGDTFEVNPDWKWQQQTGDRVRPTGYDAPEMNTLAGRMANDKLATLIIGKQVQLGPAYKIDTGRLVCDVYFNGKKLEEYFPRY
ncbi:thermonuclease family protein [Nitrospira sp. Nam80]